MKYYVELAVEYGFTLGRLYPVNNDRVYDDEGDGRLSWMLEDQTGYVVEL